MGCDDVGPVTADVAESTPAQPSETSGLASHQLNSVKGAEVLADCADDLTEPVPVSAAPPSVDAEPALAGQSLTSSSSGQELPPEKRMEADQAMPHARVSPGVPTPPVSAASRAAAPPPLSPALPPGSSAHHNTPPTAPEQVLQQQVGALMKQLRIIKRQLDECTAARRLAHRRASDAETAAAAAQQQAQAAATALQEARADNSDAARYIMQLEDELHAVKSKEASAQRSTQAEAAAAASAAQQLQRQAAQSAGSLQALQRQLEAALLREADLNKQLTASRAAEAKLECILAAAQVQATAPQQVDPHSISAGTTTAAKLQARTPVPEEFDGSYPTGDTCPSCQRLRQQLGGRSAKIASLQDQVHALREAVATAEASSSKGGQQEMSGVDLNGFVPREAIAKLFVMTRDTTQEAADRHVALEMLSSMLELTAEQQITVGARLPSVSLLPFMEESSPATAAQVSSGAADSLADEWVRFLGGGRQHDQEVGAVSRAAPAPTPAGEHVNATKRLP